MEIILRYSLKQLLSENVGNIAFPAFCLLILLCNIHMWLPGETSFVIKDAFIFYPEKFVLGQWWRGVTHLFVHVSYYHLLLDVSLCWFLWKRLSFINWKKRIFLASTITAVSLGFVSVFSPVVSRIGLCGLSGVGHGLAGYLLLQASILEKNRFWKAAFLVLILLVMVKCIVEGTGNGQWISFFHWGNVGTPLASCHIGGLTGGVLFWIAEKSFPRNLGFRGHIQTPRI